jgi:hypothetical protein
MYFQHVLFHGFNVTQLFQTLVAGEEISVFDMHIQVASVPKILSASVTGQVNMLEIDMSFQELLCANVFITLAAIIFETATFAINT